MYNSYIFFIYNIGGYEIFLLIKKDLRTIDIENNRYNFAQIFCGDAFFTEFLRRILFPLHFRSSLQPDRKRVFPGKSLYCRIFNKKEDWELTRKRKKPMSLLQIYDKIKVE